MHNKTLNALSQRGTVIQQSENAAIEYEVDWAALLDTDTIATSTWTAEDQGTIANESNTTTSAKATLSADVGYARFTNKITTAMGDTDERQITLVVKANAYPISDYCD